MIIKRKLKIEGMHCTSCAMNIDFDLEDLGGIKSVNTNYAKSETEVEFDEEKISVEQIVKSIENTGYKAQP
ncbi:MAG: heavy-metal-associated domain-containing protein [Candidatus Levybacteria bacterium]|nr:heavy-metal-associated domain-containing protein [Candidatus Levybacteria bacterium]